MKKRPVFLLSLMTFMAMCVPAFSAAAAGEEYSPAAGSWKLDAVYENSDAEHPVFLDREESQSLYGSGLNILNFQEDGYAHDLAFEGQDMMDSDGRWKTMSANVFQYEEEGMELTFTYDEEEDTLHRSFTDDNPEADYKNLDFVYTRAITGSWKLYKVLEIHPGDAPVELSREENQSRYGSAENVLTFFNQEKKTCELVKDGADSVEVEGKWEMTAPDVYLYTQDGTELEFHYFCLDDTISYDVKEENAEPEQPYLSFIYSRCETPA